MPTALGLVQWPVLQQKIANLLPDYQFHWGLQLNGAVVIAADLRPAFLIVDLDHAPNWEPIIVVLQTNNATRRIPLIGLTDQKKEFPDFAALLTPDEIDEKLPVLIAQYARLWDAAYYQTMETACAESLPEVAREGIRLFNAHEFWEAHEVLEQAWIAEKRPVGELYRAILQVGVAYYQIQQGNYRGAIKMFLRAVQWLDPLPDTCQGIDVAQFKRDATAARAALEALTPDTIENFDRSLFKPVPFIN